MKALIKKSGRYTYVLTNTNIYYDGLGEITMYGISMMDRTKVYQVDDISPDYGFVYNLFVPMVELRLHPEHFYDVVEDYISDHSPDECAMSMPIKFPFTA